MTGTDFAGWQAQPDRDTVQGRIEAAGRAALPTGPGAKDTRGRGPGGPTPGVHAEGQVSSFRRARRDSSRGGSGRGLNALLPGSIRVLAAAEAAPDLSRPFRCRGQDVPLSPADGRSGLAPCGAAMPGRWADGLSREALEEAARRSHRPPMTSAPSSPHVPGKSRKHPFGTSWRRDLSRRGNELIFEVTADGFLRYMVRRMVGDPRGNRAGDSFHRTGSPKCSVIPARPVRGSGRPRPGSASTACTTALAGHC